MHLHITIQPNSPLCSVYSILTHLGYDLFKNANFLLTCQVIYRMHCVTVSSLLMCLDAQKMILLANLEKLCTSEKSIKIHHQTEYLILFDYSKTGRNVKQPLAKDSQCKQMNFSVLILHTYTLLSLRVILF